MFLVAGDKPHMLQNHGLVREITRKIGTLATVLVPHLYRLSTLSLQLL